MKNSLRKAKSRYQNSIRLHLVYSHEKVLEIQLQIYNPIRVVQKNQLLNMLTKQRMDD